MSDLIAARYDEVSASEFEDDMVVIVITDEQSEDIEVISDLDDLFVNTEVVVIDGDALGKVRISRSFLPKLTR